MKLIKPNIYARHLKLSLIIIGFTFPQTLLANKKHHHHGHGAHVHGSATLNIAFDGLAGKIEFKSPAEAVLGFEHEAKTASEITIKNSAIENFEKNISNMIQIEAQLGCNFVKEKISLEQDIKSKNSKKSNSKSEHSDFIAEFNVNCEKSIKGTKIKFNFSGIKRLNKINATVLVNEIQKSVEIKKSEVILDLN